MFNELIYNHAQAVLIAAGVIIFFLISLVIILIMKQRKRSALSDSELYEEMDGIEFEAYCADLLKSNGFDEVEVTPASADFGVDIFAEKEGVTYAFQCKLYDRPVGTKAVQEIYTGRDFYHCMVGVVLTNQQFTSGAYKLAEALNILLWGDTVLSELEENTGS